MSVSVEEMTLLSSDLSDYFVRRLSEVNRFTREAVASGLDDFAHKSNLQRQQGRTHLSWSELFERSRQIVELRVRRDLERQGHDNSENAHHFAYAVFDRLLHFFYALNKTFMRFTLRIRL